MPHQNTGSTKATAQNAVQGHEPNADKPANGRMQQEPRSYAAPAAGEVSDYMDEGDPSMGAQQGANHTNREQHVRGSTIQGAKTRTANKDIVSGRGGGGQ